MLSKKRPQTVSSGDTPQQDGHSVPRNAVHIRDLKGREREWGNFVDPEVTAFGNIRSVW